MPAAQQIEALAAGAGLSVEWVEPIASPHRPLGGRDELIEAYTKLHIFNLTRYSRVLSSSKARSKGRSKGSSKGRDLHPSDLHLVKVVVKVETYIQATYI